MFKSVFDVWFATWFSTIFGKQEIPSSTVYLTDNNGVYLTDNNGVYLITR